MQAIFQPGTGARAGHLCCVSWGSPPAGEEVLMDVARNLARQPARSVLVGVLNAVLLSLVMVPAFKAGISPMPEPPGVAFASLVTGTRQPLPVGLLFHLVYVMFWSLAFIAVAYPRLTFLRALLLGALLWAVALIVFFPLIGWGLLGLGVGPRLIVAALVPHVLFSVFLWGLCRALLDTAPAGSASEAREP